MRKILLIATVLLSGCHDVDKTVVGGKLKDLWPQVSDNEFLRSRGVGVPPEKVVGHTRRRGLSRNAALVSARYEMLAVLKGVTVGGGLTVGDLMQTNGLIKEVANRIISGAVEVQTEWALDDGCVVTLELRREEIEALAQRDAPHEPAVERRTSAVTLPGMVGEPKTVVHPDMDAATLSVVRAFAAHGVNGEGSYFPTGTTGLGLVGQEK